MAKLYFRYSSMAAGKSLDLLKVAYNYEEREKEVLIFTSKKDDRYGEGKVASRTGLEKKARGIDEYNNLFEEVSVLKKMPSCVLVDEAQFLTKQQVLQLTDIVDNLDIPVICYGIRSDYRYEPFVGSTYLMALADSIEEIKTICHCGKKATMNMRVIDGKAVYEGEQVVIGGNESYVVVCRKHFKEGKIK
ncbi:thymidine kinase [bacterium AH-315-C07]|nr:thymidine kinase [bacterium AH-315-C07]